MDEPLQEVPLGLGFAALQASSSSSCAAKCSPRRISPAPARGALHALSVLGTDSRLVLSAGGDDPAGGGRSLLPRQAEAAFAGSSVRHGGTVEQPDLVICDIARIDAEEVAEAYPEVPIVGFTNHTDTAGLRRAHAAGFDQVRRQIGARRAGPELSES